MINLYFGLKRSQITFLNFSLSFVNGVCTFAGDIIFERVCFIFTGDGELLNTMPLSGIIVCLPGCPILMVDSYLSISTKLLPVSTFIDMKLGDLMLIFSYLSSVLT